MSNDNKYNLINLSTETLKFELYILNKIVERISYYNHPTQISFQQTELYQENWHVPADGYRLKNQVLFVFDRFKSIGLLKDYTQPIHRNLIEQFRCEPNDTEIRLYRDFIAVELNKRAEIPNHQTIISDDTLEWPKDFIWQGEHTYDLAQKGKISFMPKNKNKTEIYFKMMESKKDWVKVTDMSNETGETSQQVRVKLNQIKRDKIENKGLGRLITVEPKKDYSNGAYRLHPYPKLNV